MHPSGEEAKKILPSGIQLIYFFDSLLPCYISIISCVLLVFLYMCSVCHSKKNKILIKSEVIENMRYRMESLLIKGLVQI